MTASCPGFATYQSQPNWQVAVNGQLPLASVQSESLIREVWAKYGGIITRVANKYRIPAAWLVGILMAESKGNQYACSPCSACRPELCTTGAGLRCCAFGLMQFIAPTAANYGASPDELITNPAKSLDIGGQLIVDLAEKVGFDLVRIAAAYNGGYNRCGKEDTTFGWQTHGDYPMEVVKYTNTFVEMQLVASPGSSIVGAFVLTLGVGLAAGFYTGRIRNPWRS